MTQRSDHLRSHPGEVSFPGGKQDKEDDGDDWKTAYRETREEVGLTFSKKMTTLLLEDQEQQPHEETPALYLEEMARFPAIESLHHLCVTPLVGFVNQSSVELDQRIHINPSEVQRSFWVPLSYFLTTKPDEEYDIEWMGDIFVFRKYLYPIEMNRQIPITGLTAHVARQVAEIAFPELVVDQSPRMTDTDLPNPRHGDSKTAIEVSGTSPAKVVEDSDPITKSREGILWRQIQSDRTITGRRTRAGNRKEEEHEKEDPSGTSSSRWIQYYYSLSGGILHQYDNLSVARRKSQTATKKNRLKILHDDSIHVVLLQQIPSTEATVKAAPLTASEETIPTLATTAVPTNAIPSAIAENGVLNVILPEKSLQQQRDDDSNNELKEGRRLQEESRPRGIDHLRFPFEIVALEGRIVWTLAAASEEERSLWQSWIMEERRSTTTAK